tara:strand:- start:18406 stop:22422 length:4017 start_codon:yes stop_codon:yes gene_type:complete
MDTSKLRKFGQFARRTLMEQVGAKLESVRAEGAAAQREHPEAMQKLEAAIARYGEGQVIERVAYIWFNRFSALRYMDANELNPVRVVSPLPGQFQPEILTEAKAGNINEDLVPEKISTQVRALLDGRAPSPDSQAEAYRLLLVAVCNYWHRVMPFLFERIDDYTELLLPGDLQSNASILAYLSEAMTPDVCEDVEIIGWLYQFYISEKKDQVFAGLKKNQKITAENIPAATQLFTPHWIVRYLVENSLGRLWLLNRPDSKLAERMDYYIAPEEPETDFLRIGKPKEIRICDPACGSGHMLTYAFDLLYAIYEEEGYEATEIPGMILRHNLTGVEIDDRAGALAAFALAMKAAAKLGRRRFMRMEEKPSIVVLQELPFKLGEFNDLLAELGHDLNVDRVASDLKTEPLAISGIWSQVSRYLTAAESSNFENIFESEVQGFKKHLANDIGMFEEVSQNPFLPNQLRELRADLVTIANADKEPGKRESLEKAFEKRAQSPCLAARVAAIGADFRRHKNDTTYRMDLDALVERAEEAARSPNALAELRLVETGLAETVAFHAPLWATLKQFEQAKNFGSLIVPELSDPAETLRIVGERDFGDELLLKEAQERVVTLLRMAEALSPKYHVVVANPPYMGGKGMNPDLGAWTKKHYKPAKNDLMTCFMIRCEALLIPSGYWSMINLPSWMFLVTFEAFRGDLLTSNTVTSLVHLGRGLFGSDFGTVAFSMQKAVPSQDSKGIYRRLFEQHVQVRSPETIQKLFLDHSFGRFDFKQSDFGKIPTSPIVYWLPKSIVEMFTGASIKDHLDAKQGLGTGDNERFMRQWFEVPTSEIGFGFSDKIEAKKSGLKWFPINKGGAFRKWYGNQDFIINWQYDGREVKEYVDQRYPYLKGNIDFVIKDRGRFFHECLSWSDVTSGSSSFRYYPSGFLYNLAGHSAFVDNGQERSLGLSFANTNVCASIIPALNPTLHFNIGNFDQLPWPERVSASAVEKAVSQLVSFARSDWNAYETSWDFTTLQLLSPDPSGETLEATYARLRVHWQGMTGEMQRLEEENNRIFIDAYDLQDELIPEVPQKEITLTCNPAYRYGVKGSESERESRLRADTMAEFLSYAVGCMFGRYSLDGPGLILANQGETLEDYLAKVPEPTFMPDEDNVIPVLGGDWFSDDITERFRLFLRVTFGDAHFQENLKFTEEALGKDIRKYFTRDFYGDHVRRYKKRPIYWMFSSPKGTFNALIYMHRYRGDTVSVILNDYLREFISKLEAERGRLEKLSDDSSASQGQRTKALKDVAVVVKQIDELNEWERDVVFPLAQAKIEIDLDDGVKANYPKFGAALKKVAGLQAKND